MNHGVVATQPIPQGLADLLNKQDCLYHVYLEGIKDKKPVKEVTLVKSVVKALNPYSEYDIYKNLFLSPDLEMIISNTTEAGIRYEEGDDLNAFPPKSYPAKITALLHQRFQKFNGATDKGLLIICCELIEDNGSTLREYVLKHAAYNHLGDDFIQWIHTACHFYDTLVDRIVPGFPRETINEDPEELKKFSAKILERFYNPFIKHYLKDISLNSLSKWETRNFPTLKDNAENLKKEAKLTTFSFAALLILYSGKSEVAFTPNDTPEFVEFIQNTFNPNDIESWVKNVISNSKMWTIDLSVIPGFAANVSKYAELILQKGMKAALESL
jgi:mannitol-1-phosphate/altronate dehydrogenase